MNRSTVVACLLSMLFAGLMTLAGFSLAAQAAAGKPAVTARAAHLTNDQVELAVAVLAPGKTIEAVRIDNLGGVSSLWRSDGKDQTPPVAVSSGGASALGLTLNDAETPLSLTLKDNGAFAGKATDFRLTVFFTDGGRAMCELPATLVTVTAKPAPASQVAAAKPAEPATASQPAPAGNDVAKDTPKTAPLPVDAEEFFDLCAQGAPQQIEAAIKAGAAVNAKNIDGWPPLMVAAANNENPEVLSVLIKAGAAVNAQDEDGWTPLMRAAAKNNNPEVSSVLIKAGAAVNAKANDGTTPLIFAATNNQNPEVLNVLLKAGASVDAKDANGATPLMGAATNNNNPDVLSALIKAGAGVNAKNGDGSTPLMWAASNNHSPEVLSALITAGAEVDAKDTDDKTPLMLAAAKNDNPEVLSVLIKAGAKVNAKDREGRTSLNYAAETNDPEIVSLLLQAGATVSAGDLQRARSNERLKDDPIIEELQRKAK